MQTFNSIAKQFLQYNEWLLTSFQADAEPWARKHGRISLCAGCHHRSCEQRSTWKLRASKSSICGQTIDMPSSDSILAVPAMSEWNWSAAQLFQQQQWGPFSECPSKCYKWSWLSLPWSECSSSSGSFYLWRPCIIFFQQCGIFFHPRNWHWFCWWVCGHSCRHDRRCDWEKVIVPLFL